MERDIIDNIKYIKNICKKKSYIRENIYEHQKKYPNINQEDIKKILDDMVKDNVLRENGNGKNMTYIIPEEAYVFVRETQDVNDNANESENEGIVLEESNLMEQENRNNITIALNDMSNEIKKFKYFQESVESKLCLLEDQIISSKTSFLNSDTSGFIVTILKDRIYLWKASSNQKMQLLNI